MRKSTPKTAKKDEENKDYNTCSGIVEYTKSLSKSTERCIESVTLTSSQYPSCSNIIINLVSSLASKMTSTYVAIEGEAKIYKNKKCESKLDPYFLKIKPTAASPMLYQLLENIYGNIRDNKKIPSCLCNLSVENIEEKTFNKECIYINKMSGAIIEYTVQGGRSTVQSIFDEMEKLSKRDRQMAKVIIVPIVFYRNGNLTKITFALKKLIIERDFSANVININGKTERVSMAETSEEEIGRGLGITEDIDDAIDDDAESTLFNV
ncbi:45L [Yaba monkey tumor virus]|uniref:Protein OPG079 n=1 Tax=Yaba monkey tumor virus (strain VR587) TaxID=928314 RepID=Q6TUW8_YMTV5|nr:DNA-binding phosphoprotein [Yaba monkey tumor virus]AAR07401.1 45L [Yaba monkey tumor virus]